MAVAAGLEDSTKAPKYEPAKTPGPRKKREGATGSKKSAPAAAKKKIASFKHKKSDFLKSPLVDGLRKRRAAKASGMVKAKAAKASANDAEAQTRLDELRQQLVAKHAMPEDLLPTAVGSGKKSYTLHHAESAASVQVLHTKQMFYCNTDKHGCQPKQPTITWSHHGHVTDAWIYTKKILGWDWFSNEAIWLLEIEFLTDPKRMIVIRVRQQQIFCSLSMPLHHGLLHRKADWNEWLDLMRMIGYAFIPSSKCKSTAHFDLLWGIGSHDSGPT